MRARELDYGPKTTVLSAVRGGKWGVLIIQDDVEVLFVPGALVAIFLDEVTRAAIVAKGDHPAQVQP